MSLPKILREYGHAFRGDWSSSTIDGRSVLGEMNDVADWIEQPATYPGDKGAREKLGICPAGDGHWELYCDDDCAAVTE